MSRRLVLALSLAAIAGLYAWSFNAYLVDRSSDFALVWAAARGWLHSLDPYTVAGPEPWRSFRYDFHLLYPLTAVVVAVPFALIPLHVSEGIFVAVSVGLFVWAVTRERIASPVLWVLVSYAGLQFMQVAQWSALMTAAALIPALNWLLVIKPTIGLAFFAAYPSRRAAIGCALFVALTVAISPWWVHEWLDLMIRGEDSAHITAPLLQWVGGGPFLALAAWKWRRAEARLLLGLALIPHTPELYDLVPLFLIVTCLEEGMILFTCVLIAHVVRVNLLPAPNSFAQLWAVNAWVFTAFVYLPCLVMVLRRPNVWRDARNPAGHQHREIIATQQSHATNAL